VTAPWDIAIRQLPAGTPFRFGSELQTAAIHGTVAGPGREGGILVHLRPRSEHKKVKDGTRGPGTVEEWSGWVQVRPEWRPTT